MYFKGIAKKIYHFVQNHIFNRKIHIKIIENIVLLPLENSTILNLSDEFRLEYKCP